MCISEPSFHITSSALFEARRCSISGIRNIYLFMSHSGLCVVMLNQNDITTSLKNGKPAFNLGQLYICQLA